VSRIVTLLAVAAAALAAAAPGRAWTPPAQASFEDVAPATPFYSHVEAVNAAGVMSGFACGGSAEPCDAQSRPYFRPYANVTRAQAAKAVALAANVTLAASPAQATFADVDSLSPWYPYVEPLAEAGIVSGYVCGGPGEPCDAQSRPYFRPYANVTRGQAAKLVALAAELDLSSPPLQWSFEDVLPTSPFYAPIEALAATGAAGGYVCGGPGEPCDALARPYFRPYAYITRGQLAKLVALALVFSDTTPPALTVPTAVVVDATGPAGAAVTFAVAASDPDDPVRSTSCSPAPGATFPIGTTTVTCTASDTHLNDATASFTVTVNGAVAQIDTLLRSLAGSVVTKPLSYAKLYLQKGDVPNGCAALAEFDREVPLSVPKDATSLLAASAQIETVAGCKRG
jgi:hypothetical protein